MAPPLVVVGALRAGGSGKTSVVDALARHYRDQGMNVAVLTYRLGGGSSGEHFGGGPRRGGRSDDIDAAFMEVHEDTGWRSCSEEAVMLRRGAGVRVFATRNRLEAWRLLCDPEFVGPNPFDLILSDDGYQDPRLTDAFHILLTAPSEKPRFWNLLPAGAYRETWRARDRADVVAEGPYPDGMEKLKSGSGRSIGESMGGSDEAMRFYRRLILPENLDRRRSWIALCGLGDNARFVADLRRAGIRVAKLLEAADHGVVSNRRLTSAAKRFPGAGFLCTEKDGVKYDRATLDRFEIRTIGQEMALDPGVLTAIEGHLQGFASGYLVDLNP